MINPITKSILLGGAIFLIATYLSSKGLIGDDWTLCWAILGVSIACFGKGVIFKDRPS